VSEYRGIVQHGVVVLQGTALPEGTEVTIIPVKAGVPVVKGLATKTSAESASIWQKLAQLGRDAEGEPSDLAANHDHYLHGLPRRQ
jgi:hypothetical protein